MRRVPFFPCIFVVGEVVTASSASSDVQAVLQDQHDQGSIYGAVWG